MLAYCRFHDKPNSKPSRLEAQVVDGKAIIDNDKHHSDSESLEEVAAKEPAEESKELIHLRAEMQKLTAEKDKLSNKLRTENTKMQTLAAKNNKLRTENTYSGAQIILAALR